MIEYAFQFTRETITQPPPTHLGSFAAFVDMAKAQKPLFPVAPPGESTRRSAWEVFEFTAHGEQPGDARVERSWRADGVDGEEVSWSVGYGPRTYAWILKPAQAQGPLPGVLALHDHGHYKLSRKEKIADGPDEPVPGLEAFRQLYYGGRAYADQLAREGFVVLAHDAFLWGSHKFPLDEMTDMERGLAKAVEAGLGPEVSSAAADFYNGAAYSHEHVIAKYCALLGTNITAVVAYEDRAALNYLRARSDVVADQVACIGLSGGGLRAAVLRATSDHLRGCAIVGMMSTYDELINSCVAPHTWMLSPPAGAAVAIGLILQHAARLRHCSFNMRWTTPCSRLLVCAVPTSGFPPTTGRRARPTHIAANSTLDLTASMRRCRTMRLRG